jgi:hypothetical protein
MTYYIRTACEKPRLKRKYPWNYRFKPNKM